MTEGIKSYAVVEFNEIMNNKIVVELVPIGWLTENGSMCLWPPKKDEDKVKEWVELEIGPYETWIKYPIKIISKAKDYAQGLRRLKKSFKTNDVESTDSESKTTKNTELMLLSSQNVSRLLSQQQPLNKNENNQGHTESSNDSNFSSELLGGEGDSPNDNFVADKSEEAALDGIAEPKGIKNYDELAKYLQNVICTEMAKVKKSVNYTIGQQVKKILEVVQQSGDAPSKQKAWTIVGADLPYGDSASFVAFDESLKDNEDKRNALTEIFQMVSAGCTKYEDDVHKIMEKMINKEVQLQYSGCGRKVKGVGKKSFKETETYQIMEKFLMAKYQKSNGKIGVITAVSNFLSGAKDREGGRAQRNKYK
ncbi:hypothetical protein WA026_008599 [Henosepilachna vigintioctopunctata]|uniref:DUF4806 domain-containing protein n=1 Tax=Henosepilachna vigintioctopunctata TaxID=420089 RepID=A0AAW1UHV0_9CUCU